MGLRDVNFVRLNSVMWQETELFIRTTVKGSYPSELGNPCFHSEDRDDRGAT
jgi:hypothetical protein